MIDVLTLGWNEPTYSFVGDDGEQLFVAIKRLREHVLKVKPEIVLTPVTLEKANLFLQLNCVDMMRVLSFTPERLDEPIIYLKSGTYGNNGGPDVYLADGHHRYVYAAMNNFPFIKSHLLEPEFWKPYQVSGVPTRTKEWLKSLPVTTRNY